MLFSTTREARERRVKGTHLESGQSGSNRSSTTYRRRDPGPVLNAADAASALLVCARRSGFPCKLAASCRENLREAWGLSLTAGANATFHRAGPRCQESCDSREQSSANEARSRRINALAPLPSEVWSTLCRSSLGGLGSSHPRHGSAHCRFFLLVLSGIASFQRLLTLRSWLRV